MKNKLNLKSDSIFKLLIKYSVPAVLAMMVGAVYNIVDRIFIGQYIGEKALAGVTLVFPIMLTVIGVASMLEAGASSFISRKMGEGDLKSAGKYFANSISLSIVLSLLIALTVYFNLKNIILMLGGDKSIFSYASGYTVVVLIGFIPQVISQVLATTVRVEGKPNLAMFSMIFAAMTNIFLDYVFVARLSMGVEGAAYATIIGQLFGFIILLTFFMRKQSTLYYEIKDFIPAIDKSIQIVTVGVASLVSVLGISISMVFLNIQLLKYGDSSAVTAFGIVNTLYSFFIMPIMGIQQGMQTVLGYNYGASLYKRVKKIMKVSVVFSTSFSILVYSVLQIYPEFFIGMFLSGESSTMGITVKYMRIFLMMLPLLSINFFGIAFYQSMGKGKVALILSILRPLVILTPLIIILPSYYGIMGVWYAAPISDGLAILIVGYGIIRGLTKLDSSSSIRDAQVNI